MFTSIGIQINHLSFAYPASDKLLFDGLSLNFGREKLAIVGNNGCGKSTLLQLINGELTPSNGSVNRQGHIAYLPQHPVISQQQTIASVLGIEDKLAALQRIEQGSIDEIDFQLVDEDWQCQQRAQSILASFALDYLSLQQTVASLSGGELTRLHLASVFVTQADMILLDEPSNHLDHQTRQLLLQAIESYTGGVIVVTHDRSLLRLMNKIVELNSLGAKTYSGNYDAYLQQRTLEKQAAEQRLAAEVQKVEKAKAIVQQRFEKHQRNEARGRKDRADSLKAKGRLDRIALNSAKGRSEKTNRRIRIQADRKLTDLDQSLQAARSQLEIRQTFSVKLPETAVPNNKVLVDCEQVSFSYDESQPLIDNVSLKIVGPQRLALRGRNGSGKTTLVKLIIGELQPTSGIIHQHVSNIRYLDQKGLLLENDLTVLENFQKLNPKLSDFESRQRLAWFLFRNKQAQRKVAELSGGERIRALLACVLLSQQPPQLLILDEPTNHLDLESIAVIEQALLDYQGALLVISHDDDFLKNIGISSEVRL